MKPKSNRQEDGSILMMALITITILTLICAVSLSVSTQSGNATTQTTSWQQSMSGAEAAVDQAMQALNNNTWTGWNNVTNGSLPTGKPTGGSAAAGAPGNGTYNYYTSSFALQGEASNSVQMWVTIDNGSIAPISSTLSHNGQAYRIRAAAAVNAPGPTRVSNSRLDNDLRKISLNYDRYSTGLTGPQAVRRIELVAVPANSTSNWPRGITLSTWVSLSGTATVYSDIATTNSSSSDLRGQYVYGDLLYSGPAVQNAGNVQGNVSTPFAATFTAPVNPNTSGWGTTNNLQQYTSSERAGLPVYTAGNYIQYSGGGGLPKDILNNQVSTFTAGGPAANPTLIKVNGDFTVSGGGNFNLVPSAAGGATKYVVVWVTGKLTVSGGSSINQSNNVAVTWIVDNDVNISGGSYNNQTATAQNFEIVGVGNGKVTISSSSAFIGTVNAPGADFTISGSGNFTGAIIAKDLTVSGSGTFSFDNTLGGSQGVANYAYASWFEDNSNAARYITY